MLGRRNGEFTEYCLHDTLSHLVFSNAQSSEQGTQKIRKSSSPIDYQDRAETQFGESRREVKKKKSRLSEVLEGEPKNLHPNRAGDKPAMNIDNLAILLMKPHDRFMAQQVVTIGEGEENLRFNVGGPPSWHERLFRGERPTPRRRQLLQRVLVSASTLEANSRNFSKFQSSSLADKDQVLKTLQKTTGQSKGRISALNSLGALSASARGEHQDSCKFGVRDARGIHPELVKEAAASRDKSKFRSTVIPSVKGSSKFRPSLNILEGVCDDFDAGLWDAKDQHRLKEGFKAQHTTSREGMKKSYLAHSFGNFLTEEINEIGEPINISIGYRKLIERCRALDRASFEQAEEYILELEGVISSLLMDVNVARIIKDILECGRIDSLRQRFC